MVEHLNQKGRLIIPENIPEPKFQVLQLSGGKETQEDAYARVAYSKIGEKGMVVAVADGHKNKDATGAQSKETATLAASESVVALARDPHDHETIKKVFAYIQEDIAKKFPGAGTTLTDVVVDEKKLTLAYVGDSEVWMFSGDVLTRLTVPHRYIAHDAERERLEADGRPPIQNGAIQLDNGSFLGTTRSLGDAEFEPYVRHDPEVRTIELTGNEKFLLVGTDGAWDRLTNRGKNKSLLRDVLKNSPNAKVALSGIKNILTVVRRPTDNATVLLIDLRK